MYFSDFLENFKKKLKSLYKKVSDFCKENTKIALIIAVLILAILVCIIILSANSKKSKAKPEEKQEIVLTEDLVIPDGPNLPEDYNIARKNKEKWNEKEAKQWFSVPSQNEIDDLEKSNDKMIDEIIGVAP